VRGNKLTPSVLSHCWLGDMKGNELQQLPKVFFWM